MIVLSKCELYAFAFAESGCFFIVPDDESVVEPLAAFASFAFLFNMGRIRCTIIFFFTFRLR